MDIFEKINNLKLKTPENGATEEEAMAALALAEKLMAKHGVTEEQLEKVKFDRDMREGSFEQRQKQLHPSQKYCSGTIAKFCGVRHWKGWATQKKRNIECFGFREDVEMYEFLLGLIHDSMDRGWKEYLSQVPKTPGQSRHTEYWSYMLGFGTRVNEKIKELMEERVQATSGTDLVELKMAVVEQGMEVMLPSLNLKKGRRSSTRVDGDAYIKGTEGGDKVNIQRPLKKAGHTSKQLK